jgi:L-Ala-D/L-Glu epimerase / N-acetyl-D-glutamate racemase
VKLLLHRVALPLAEKFTISRGSLTTQHALIVELTDGRHTGFGEVTANAFYGHSLDQIVSSIERVRQVVEDFHFGEPEELWRDLRATISDDSFALCAIDLAAHDLFGRQHQQRLFEMWGLEASHCTYSSYTIPIDTVEGMVRRLSENTGWPCYKVKLGTENDLEIVAALRKNTSAVLRVDANCAWTADEVIEKSVKLEDLGVEFVEQPLPNDASDDDKKRVCEHSALPIVADEDCQVEADVRKCSGRFHGVNIKLCKCGGLTPALRMLRTARELGLKTMVGCMVESSIGISAAAQLLPLLDYADLDGAVLLRDEPCGGVEVRQGVVEFSDADGTGAILHQARLPEFQIEANGRN